MTDTDVAQANIAVDAVLARAGLRVTPEDYERLVGLYPTLRAQCAALRLPELRDLEPAVIYPAAFTTSFKPAPLGSTLGKSHLPG